VSPAQLIATKGPAARFELRWICRATRSFPTPLSPVISTFASPVAARRATARTSSITELAAMITGVPPAIARSGCVRSDEDIGFMTLATGRQKLLPSYTGTSCRGSRSQWMGHLFNNSKCLIVRLLRPYTRVVIAQVCSETAHAHVLTVRRRNPGGGAQARDPDTNGE